MLCVIPPPIFAYYSSGSGDNTHRFDHSQLEMEAKELTTMFFFGFIRAAEYGAANLFYRPALGH